MEHIKKILKKNSLLIGILLISLVTILAYGQTVGMYFWQDDNALIFKVQNIQGPAGYFGTGIYDRGSSYRFVATIVYPFYKLFGIEPRGYYIAGIIFYFFAALSSYLLAWVSAKNTKVALTTALIFASGYIGAESIWRISTSLHTSHMLIFLNLTFFFYVLSFRSKKRKWFFYIISLVLFVYTMETGFIRAHGILIVLLAIEFFLNFNLPKSVFKVLPFVFFYTRWYSDARGFAALEFIRMKIFKEGNFQILLTPLKTLQNIFIPSSFNFPIVLFLFLIVFILLMVRNKLLWVGLVFMLGPFVVPFLANPNMVLESTHRYITASIFGFSIFISVALYEIFRRKLSFYYLFSILVIGLHLVFVNKDAFIIVRERSMPTRKFYESLLSQVPSLEKFSALYFDVEDDAVAGGQFNNFLAVGSMPTTTSVALRYGLDRSELYLPETFGELLSLIKDGKVEKDRIYTFYYSDDGGLINTTQLTKGALFGKPVSPNLDALDRVNHEFSTPIELKITLGARLARQIVKYNAKSLPNLSLYLDYLVSKENYYKKVKASSVSEWKYQEIRNLVDSDVTTPWLGSRYHWHDQRQEEITIDLGEIRKIAALRMSYFSKNLVPTSYSYHCSIDGQVWNFIEKYAFIPVSDSGDIIDKFLTRSCRYVRVEIHETLEDDSPQLTELEVIESRFANIDFPKAQEIYENPFVYISKPQDLDLVEKYFGKNGVNTKMCIYTDKSKSPFCQKLKIALNTLRVYSVIVAPNGTRLKAIEIFKPEGIEVKVDRASITTLTYPDLEKRNYIFDYKEN